MFWLFTMFTGFGEEELGNSVVGKVEAVHGVQLQGEFISITNKINNLTEKLNFGTA